LQQQLVDQNVLSEILLIKMSFMAIKRKLREIQSSQPMIVDIVSTELTTSCKIQRNTIRRHLSSSNNLRFLKFKSKTPLTESHKRSRLEFALKNMGSREFLANRCLFRRKEI